jgi:hypothetical protein
VHSACEDIVLDVPTGWAVYQLCTNTQQTLHRPLRATVLNCASHCMLCSLAQQAAPQDYQAIQQHNLVNNYRTSQTIVLHKMYPLLLTQGAQLAAALAVLLVHSATPTVTQCNSQHGNKPVPPVGVCSSGVLATNVTNSMCSLQAVVCHTQQGYGCRGGSPVLSRLPLRRQAPSPS